MNLKEFSRQLGLSQTTVSRALSGYPEVKQATRDRVAEAALKYGYHPNRAAIGLATGRAGAVGIIMRGAGEFGPHMSEFLAGLGSSLERENVDMLLSTVDSKEMEYATYRRLAASKRVDALLLNAPTVADERIGLLDQLGLPFVLHGFTRSDKKFHYLDIDNFSAIHEATKYLIGLGHKRIAFINGHKGYNFAEERDRGYREALVAAGIEIDSALCGNADFTDDEGYQLMSGFMALDNAPTAVLAGSMMSALGAMRSVRTSGLQLGRDISLIAHDDVFPYISGDNMVPTVTITRSSIRAAGMRIGDILLKMLAGELQGFHEEVWPVELLVRESTGPAPAP